MGCCFSSEDKDEIEHQRDVEINDQIHKDKQKLNNQVKLLLLGTKKNPPLFKTQNTHSIFTTGAGESGKSTLLKQMRLINHNGFPEEERLSYREIIFNNMIESMKSILSAMKDKLDLQLADEENRYAFDLIDSLPEPMEVNHVPHLIIAPAIKKCWQDDAVQQAYKRRNEYQLYDSAA